jgi:putative spermidine/putrescine transport system ATP-binding protein
MGGQNVLSGTVSSRAGNTVTINTGAKQVTLTASDAAPAGSHFEAAVRRDHIRLSRSDSDDGPPRVNAVTGRVAAIEYQGTWLKITIDEACGEEFVVNLPDSVFFADPLTVGEPVLAQWDADKVHFLESGAQRSPRSTHLGHGEMATAEARLCAGCAAYF